MFSEVVRQSLFVAFSLNLPRLFVCLVSLNTLSPPTEAQKIKNKELKSNQRINKQTLDDHQMPNFKILNTPQVIDTFIFWV